MILKRIVSLLISAALLLPVLTMNASAAQVLAEPYTLTAEELSLRVVETYDQARTLAGRRNFHGKCSTLVNCSTLALGIQSIRFDGDGRDEYDLYDDITRTDEGYDVVRYDASQYDLAAALNAITENGTRDAYNIIVGFEGGRTASSSKYGHTCFVHGIVDGMVYYCESYDLYLGDVYYPEGELIVCSIEEFANYYNIWATLEGVIHFDFPDEEPPALTELHVIRVSEEGFTLGFRATDNMEITELYAEVRTYGQDAGHAVTVPVMLIGGNAFVRVEAEDFDGFQGRYYVNCYASDRKGNVASISTSDEGVCLYQWEPDEGLYRVARNNTGVHNAPGVWVNEAITRESVVNRGQEVQISGSYVNERGEHWYLLTDGGWVLAAYLEKVESLQEQIEAFLAELRSTYLSIFM